MKLQQYLNGGLMKSHLEFLSNHVTGEKSEINEVFGIASMAGQKVFYFKTGEEPKDGAYKFCLSYLPVFHGLKACVFDPKGGIGKDWKELRGPRSGKKGAHPLIPVAFNLRPVEATERDAEEIVYFHPCQHGESSDGKRSVYRGSLLCAELVHIEGGNVALLDFDESVTLTNAQNQIILEDVYLLPVLLPNLSTIFVAFEQGLYDDQLQEFLDADPQEYLVAIDRDLYTCDEWSTLVAHYNEDSGPSVSLSAR